MIILYKSLVNWNTAAPLELTKDLWFTKRIKGMSDVNLEVGAFEKAENYFPSTPQNATASSWFQRLPMANNNRLEKKRKFVLVPLLLKYHNSFNMTMEHTTQWRELNGRLTVQGTTWEMDEEISR